jgi:exodeoxyribonuclease V gamma subunit
VTIGRTRDGGAKRANLSIARIGPLDTAPETRQAVAVEHLETLVDLFRRGMREPLPLYCRTSAAWAASARQGQPAERAAAKEWTSAYRWDREDRDPEHVLVLGGELAFDRLLAHSGLRRGDEDGEGWEPSEPSRLGRYARRLWDGLLDHEDLVDR